MTSTLALASIASSSASSSCRIGRSRPTNGVAFRSADGSDRDDAPGGHGLGLALGVQRLDRLGHDRVAHESPGRLADQHATGLGGRLQARGGVHRVADDRRVLAGQDHLAGRDPDPGGETDRQALVQRLEPLVHLDRRPHRSQSVVLVGKRHAEHGDDRVSDEFLHAAAVALGGRAHLGEVALQDRAKQFWIVALSETGRSDEIAEESRHGPAGLGRRGGFQRSGALLAELRAVAVFVSTRGADTHGSMLLTTEGPPSAGPLHRRWRDHLPKAHDHRTGSMRRSLE